MHTHGSCRSTFVFFLSLGLHNHRKKEISTYLQLGADFNTEILKDSSFSDSGYEGSESMDDIPVVVSAIARVVQLLAADRSLVDISLKAIETRGPGGFEQGFANLLKIFAEDLSKAVSHEYERQVCKLIDGKGRQVAVRFRSSISPSENRDSTNLASVIQSPVQRIVLDRFLKALPESYDIQTQQENEAHVEEHRGADRDQIVTSTDDQTELVETGEEDLDNLEIADQFILSGSAFSNLKDNMKTAFLTTRTPYVGGLRQVEMISSQDAGEVKPVAPVQSKLLVGSVLSQRECESQSSPHNLGIEYNRKLPFASDTC